MDLPSTPMDAVVVTSAGGPDNLAMGRVPVPRPAAHQLLVEVHATALNRADLLQRRGLYPPPAGASDLLGLEAAGRVTIAGSACRRFAAGDRVFGILPGGGYGRYAVMDEGCAMAIPGTMDVVQAAATAEVFLTAYQALFWLGKLQPGHSVLLHGGAGGVGTAAIQLARQRGARPMVTAGGAKKCALCRRLGADPAIDYRSRPFAEEVDRATGGRGVDLVIDTVGAPYLEDNLSCLATDGRMVILGLMGGKTAKNLDLGVLLAKRLKLIGTTLRHRPPAYKHRLTAAFAADFMDDLAAGRIGPVIDSVYPWHRAAEAHRRMEANANMGKIVLEVETD